MTRKIIGVLALAMFLLASVYIATAADNPPRIMVDEVKAKLDSGQKIIFIDTRTGSEWKNSSQMIPGAIRVRGNPDFAAVIKTLHKDDFIVTYCT